MNNATLSEIVASNIRKLDEIGEHTEYKIKYISAYVEEWLYVQLNNNKVKNINFIDCMCNAGVYKNEQLGTPIEVLKLFIKNAPKYTNKVFNLFLNDFDKSRTEIIEKITNSFKYEEHSNINVSISNEDVNAYIEKQKDNKCFKPLNYTLPGTILFFDPYNFGTVKIKKIMDFVHANYSELIFNIFNSDYRRNINHSKRKREQMIESMEGIEGFSSDMDEKELIKVIGDSLKKKNINYCFPYSFKNKPGVELYQIFYATPHLEGLKKLKKSIWDIFDGDCFHKNSSTSSGQGTLFGSDVVKEMNIKNFSKEAQELILKEFSEKTVAYCEISSYVLESTMLRDGQIIDEVLKPLIKAHKIKKCNKVIYNHNYKNDTFKFV